MYMIMVYTICVSILVGRTRDNVYIYIYIYTYMHSVYIYIYIYLWRISKNKLPHGLSVWPDDEWGEVSQLAKGA